MPVVGSQGTKILSNIYDGVKSLFQQVQNDNKGYKGVIKCKKLFRNGFPAVC